MDRLKVNLQRIVLLLQGQEYQLLLPEDINLGLKKVRMYLMNQFAEDHFAAAGTTISAIAAKSLIHSDFKKWKYI